MPKQSKAHVTISINAQDTLLKDVYKRRSIEACGLLMGSIDDDGNWHIERAHPLRNSFDSPVYFEFAPEDVLAVELDYPQQIVGVYHSHPRGLAVASSTDRKNMQRVNEDQQIPWMWLIVSGPFGENPAPLQQVKRHSGPVTGPVIIAYHHYEHQGLRQLSIQLEEPTR